MVGKREASGCETREEDEKNIEVAKAKFTE